MTKNEKTAKRSKKNLLLIIFGGFLGTYLVIIFFEALVFANIFGPFVTIAGVNVGLKSKKSANALIQTNWENYLAQNITIGDNPYPVSALVDSPNIESSINHALTEQASEYLTFSVLKRKEYFLDTALNDKKVNEILLSEFDSNMVKTEDAKLVLEKNIRIIPEKIGHSLLIANTYENIHSNISLMRNDVDLVFCEILPSVSENDIENLLARVAEITANDITLSSGKNEYVLSKATLKSWVKIQAKNSKSSAIKEDIFAFMKEQSDYEYFDNTKVVNWVNDFSKKTDSTAVNATITMVDNKASIVVASKNGYTLDQDNLVNEILNIKNDQKTIALKIDENKPDVRSDNLNELGINELISTGWTDFKGSPKNRIHNLTVGATKFNSVLIKPDENFSFNTTLGPVDASTGYLPELVILTNKTVPEYGGGMCQVSSTAFRAALNAGLPIIERKAHAYPVSYYKPYGVDATIYLPKPDLVFKNDTGHYILIQTRIVGTKLYFDFYGTKPARTLKFSGNQNATNAVDNVEKVTPAITDQGARGNNSFTAIIYRHIYDLTGKLIDNDKFVSKYDSPDNYPH